MSEEGFQESVRRLRKVLDEAFRATLRDLVGNTLIGDEPFLMSALGDGKKIRGCLTCIIGEALGADQERFLPRAVAIELIQAATLIHDDFVDQDRTRRNRPAIWTVEGPRKAVLLGDVIFAGAIRMMSELSREDGLAVARAIAKISAGALNEPLNAGDLRLLLEHAAGNGRSLYEKIIHLKTGILFGTACELGAIAATAPPATREAAHRYGLRIGDAYQIADDLKDIRSCASDGGARPEQIAALAPAILYFAANAGPRLLRLLEGGDREQAGGLRELAHAVEGPMEQEIERLLRAAAPEIDGYLPENGAGRLVREAPWGTIRMFTGG